MKLGDESPLTEFDLGDLVCLFFRLEELGLLDVGPARGNRMRESPNV